MFKIETVTSLTRGSRKKSREIKMRFNISVKEAVISKEFVQYCALICRENRVGKSCFLIFAQKTVDFYA